MYANDAAARLCGLESAEEMLALAGPELLARFEILGEDGGALAIDELPSRRALVTRATHEAVVCYRMRSSGEERWSVVRATPILTPEGHVQLVINVFRDVTEERDAEARLHFLAEAGSLLSASLDYEATLADLAGLLVPRIADYCIVDALDEDGTLRRRLPRRRPARPPPASRGRGRVR